MSGIMKQELGLSTVHDRSNRWVPLARRCPARAKSDNHSEESGEGSGSLDKSTTSEEDSLEVMQKFTCTHLWVFFTNVITSYEY